MYFNGLCLFGNWGNSRKSLKVNYLPKSMVKYKPYAKTYYDISGVLCLIFMDAWIQTFIFFIFLSIVKSTYNYTLWLIIPSRVTEKDPI